MPNIFMCRENRNIKVEEEKGKKGNKAEGTVRLRLSPSVCLFDSRYELQGCPSA